MIQDIQKILESDWAFEMIDVKLANKKRYTQKEAKELASALEKIYAISHCISCELCQVKYKKK
jgi:succinate dehydrogenase/fumarate reductase-like Fe-S protein